MNIDQRILEILGRGRVEQHLFYLPPGQLDRLTYVATNKVLECLGGKWDRKAKAHVFQSNISNAIDDVLLTGTIIDKKTEFQMFETPPDVVQRLIILAEISSPTYRCLEPSAGRGNIARALRAIVGNAFVCVELNPDNALYLMQEGFPVICMDFLEYTPPSRFDRIVMNPPFTRQQDIQHVLHALTLLAPGGILVSVMSTGIKFRQDRWTQAFWETGHEHTVTHYDLPPGAFKVSGTMVNTMIVKIQRVMR